MTKQKQTKSTLPTESSVQIDCIKLIRSLSPFTHIIVNAQSRGKQTIGQAMKIKREGFVSGQPDIIVIRQCFDSDNGRIINGMFLELKREKTRILKKDGTYASDTIAEQAHYFEKYGQNMYCNFGIGYEHAEKIIQKFFSFKEIKITEFETI
jgi:hypothetical protein